MNKVAKFGGTSLSDVKQWQKVKNIVRSDEKRKIIVVSAPGKRSESDDKVTDLLLLLFEHNRYNVNYDNLFSQIKQRFTEIKDGLNLNTNLENEFSEFIPSSDEILTKDYLASRGEYLTAKLMAEYLGFVFVDASELIIVGLDGAIDYPSSITKAEVILGNYDQGYVIPGFYGAYLTGEIKTFARGGSDITGAILSKIMNVECYENWTDVSGIFMADPKIVDYPKRIDVMTQGELREMSYRGANVLHEEALLPLKNTNIPIHICNTNDPKSPGTLIVASINQDTTHGIITGVVGKKDYSAVNIFKNPTLDNDDVLIKVLQIFRKYQVHVEHIPTSADSFSVIVKSEKFTRSQHQIINEVNLQCQPLAIEVMDKMSLIAVVGRNMKGRPGICGRIFRLLGEHRINIKMLNKDCNEMVIILGVENDQFNSAIELIYQDFTNE